MRDIMQATDREIAQFYGGVVVPIIGRTHFDFSYLPSTGKETVTLARAVNVAFATSALLACRVHANNIGSAASIDIKCFATAPSSEDPADFSHTVASLSVTVDTQTAPFYLDVSLATPPPGGWFKVNLIANQRSGSQVNVAAQLSAFLVLRNR